MQRFSQAEQGHKRNGGVTSLLSRLADDRGSEMVEFALASCIWIAAAFMIMYVSFALYTAHFVANAANEAARYASVRGSSWSGSCTSKTLDCTASSTDISQYVASMVPPGISRSSISVSTSWPGTTSTGTACDTADGSNGPNCTVNVTVSYNFSFPIPFVSNSQRLFSSTSQMTIVR
ncbi:TadE/TadG family type IV pilus assembly protein [Occallatibacter savannae]|uniref:TadE/TadG family type IV pilus assembly protein n=1 Tax=Occallatibacter savannae TaxID=1002691 RepID=UPI000D689459|nr:TadE/TadG family type IV pilus assembly protein [Occallatibacter savannae]